MTLSRNFLSMRKTKKTNHRGGGIMNDNGGKILRLYAVTTAARIGNHIITNGRLQTSRFITDSMTLVFSRTN